MWKFIVVENWVMFLDDALYMRVDCYLVLTCGQIIHLQMFMVRVGPTGEGFVFIGS